MGLSLSSEPGSQALETVAYAGWVSFCRTVQETRMRVLVACPLLGKSEASSVDFSFPEAAGGEMAVKDQAAFLRQTGGGKTQVCIDHHHPQLRTR